MTCVVFVRLCEIHIYVLMSPWFGVVVAIDSPTVTLSTRSGRSGCGQIENR
jgi:hypothetical protein